MWIEDMGSGWLMLAFLLALAATFVGVQLLTQTIAKIYRRRFLRGRPAMNDSEFLRSIDAAPEFAQHVIASRKSLAEMCAVPQEMIHPIDEMENLSALMQSWLLDGFDGIYFLWTLEKELNVKMDTTILPPLGGTAGSWLLALAARCVAAAASAQSRELPC